MYRLSVTDELFREQFELLYDFPMSKPERKQAEINCREQLSSVVLIELLVCNPDAKFEISNFTQRQTGQAAWAEVYLSLDGEMLAVERWSKPEKLSDMRIAFFIHFWQSDQPLCTSYGDIMCPEVKEMPARLERLVPFTSVD